MPSVLTLGAAGTSLVSQFLGSFTDATGTTVAAFPPPASALGTAGACALAFAAAASVTRRRGGVVSRSSSETSPNSARATREDALNAALAIEETRRQRVREVRKQLLDVARQLGNDALLPSGGSPDFRRSADSLVTELLSLALPPDAAVPPSGSATLEGAWTLAYASLGTVVTRALSSPVSRAFSPVVFDIRQRLQPMAAAQSTLAVDNTACVRLGPLGVWRLSAVGDWEGAPDAAVTFNQFGVEPVEVFGIGVDGVPSIKVTVPQPMRRAAMFRTLYLDSKVRIAEGVQSGNRFVFVRDKLQLPQ